MTLVFLGYLPETAIPRLEELLAATVTAAPDAPVLTPERLAPLPPRRPRLFAVELADPEGRAVALQRDLAAALARERLHRPERREFWPHVTIARVRRGRSGTTPTAPPPLPAEPFEAGPLTLYRSYLGPAGARYEPLARISLTGGSG